MIDTPDVETIQRFPTVAGRACDLKARFAAEVVAQIETAVKAVHENFTITAHRDKRSVRVLVRFMHEVTDPAMKDVVIQVFASGYRIGDTVLRPAKVIVGSYTAPPEPEVVEAEEVSQEQPEEDAE